MPVYIEPHPTDSAGSKFAGVLTDEGNATNDFVAAAGVNRRTQNGETVADLSVYVAGDSGMAATPALYNKTLTTLNYEYSQALPVNCKSLYFHCRSAVEVRYAFVSGKVDASIAPYGILPAGAVYYKEGMRMPAGTLYLACSTAGVVVDIEVWS